MLQPSSWLGARWQGVGVPKFCLSHMHIQDKLTGDSDRPVPWGKISDYPSGLDSYGLLGAGEGTVGGCLFPSRS
jgi:hypothetical protein